jgi:hypothetical protein
MSSLPPPALPSVPPPALPVSARPTNNLAIISLIAGIGSFVAHIIPFVGGAAVAIVAVVTGHVARRQIKTTGEGGYGLATAGMVIGYVHLVLLALLLVAGIILLILLFVWGASFINNLPTPTPVTYPS